MTGAGVGGAGVGGAGGGARILVVEDSATQAVALSTLLERAGHETLLARTGEQALALVRRERVDLVLTDVLMPGIDGYEVCRRIKAEPGCERVPVVLLTSLSDPLAIVRGLECGADHYVTKPYDPERLLARVRHVLRRAVEPTTVPGRPVTVDLLGTPFTISATKEQILDLLVSSYGDLVRTSEAVRAAEQRARFLAEAGELLSASLDAERVLRDLAGLAVPALADLCAVDIVEDGGRLRRVSVAHADPARAALAAALMAYPHVRERASVVQRAVADGATQLVSPVDEAQLRALAQDDAHLALLRALSPRALLAVPLRARGHTLGAMLFVSAESGRDYDEETVALATDLARRAALAVDNARLYHEARQATRARDDVLAVVSHDLRNPINTIQMSASFLLELLQARTAVPALESQLAVIRRAAGRADALIQDLLDVTRIESGTLAVQAAPVDAASLVADALAEMQPVAARQSLVLAGEWRGPGARVRADRGRVMQVLSNLVGNAVKFTPAGGHVELTGLVAGGVAEFVIADTGPGIPAEHLPHLFDRFWQATRAGRAGAGLGLFIARGIVEAHGGELRVTSAVGRGSTFAFTLPLAAEGSD